MSGKKKTLGYDQHLVYKDVVKTLIVTLVVLVVLAGVYLINTNRGLTL